MQWIDQATQELLAARGRDKAWGYRVGSAPSSEPTALAGLALLESKKTEAGAAGTWLAGAQQADGSVGVSASQAQPAWPTPLAVLLWASLGNQTKARQRAVAWLLSHQGKHHDHQDDFLAHDTSIPGWPWVENTHSWIEPTAQAILALRCEGQGEHARARDGLRMIRNRALPSGGWNCGLTVIFGSELRPQPTPTGLALLALAGTQAADQVVEQACTYLEKTLPQVRAPLSLSWGLLGLAAWGRMPADAPKWLAEGYAAARKQRDCLCLHLAMLLLAAQGRLPERKAGDG